MSDPTALTLRDAAAAIAQKRLHAEAVIEACLDRAHRLQTSLNCFISIEADEAKQHAQASNTAIKKGRKLGPLHGVPLAHKDMFYRAGKFCSCGAKIRAHFVPDHTATVLNRLDEAGAIELGRLNMAEFAMGPTGHNEHYGRCRNPWNPDYITGGSSSGSGAAVAAGLVSARSVPIPADRLVCRPLHAAWSGSSRHRAASAAMARCRCRIPSIASACWRAASATAPGF